MFKKFSLTTILLLLTSCGSHFSKNSTQEKPVVATKEEYVAQVKKSENKHVVFFDTNSSKLTKEASSSLEKEALPMVKEVTKESLGKIIIEGYCDERGSVSYNKKLGQKRANAVKEFLVKNGVKSAKISVKSYGKAMPVDAAHSEEAWAKNRRAVTVSVKI